MVMEVLVLVVLPRATRPILNSISGCGRRWRDLANLLLWIILLGRIVLVIMVRRRVMNVRTNLAMVNY